MSSRIFQPETALSPARKNVFASLALCVLVFMVYANTFDASWHFDDVINITDNASVHLTEFNWTNLKKSFFLPNGKLFRPAANLSFALNYYVGGLDVFGYHLVNTILHAMAAVLLFLFIHRTLHLPLIREKIREHAYGISLLAAALWAINPVQSQAVTYIVQRMAAMAALFSLASLYFYARARLSRDGGALFYGLSVACFLLALASKENTILIPVIAFLYDVILIQGESPGAWVRRNRRLCLVMCVLFAALFIGYLLALEKGGLTAFLAGFDKRAYGPLERLMTQPRVLLFYLGLLLYPDPGRLCVNHDFTVSRGLLDPLSTLPAMVIVAAAVLGALIFSRKRPLISFCLLFFFINHAVESSFLPLEMVFEHRNYLPSMLLFLPPALGLAHLLFHSPLSRTVRTLIAAAIVLFLVGQGHATFLRNFSWKTEESLWVDCIEKYPQLWRPYVNLGKYYSDTNRPLEAIRQYEKALGKRTANDKRENFFYKTYYNLGVEHFRLGHETEALGYFRKALEIYDGDPKLLNNLGALFFVQGKRAQAETLLRRALRRKPRYRPALTNLGGLLLERGDVKEALVLLQRALKTNPRNRAILLRTSLAYRLRGRHGRALMYAKKALSGRKPRFQDMLFLAETYEAAGLTRRARGILDRALLQGSPEGLRHFMDGLGNPQPPQVLFPHRAFTLKRLARACRHRGERFLEAARYAEKKGAGL